MNKYLIEILTFLAIVIIVVLLVRMFALESSIIELTTGDDEPDPTAGETPAGETPPAS